MPQRDSDAETPLLATDDGAEHNRDNQTADYGTAASASQSERGTFKRSLGTVEAFGIVISIVIGSGAFTSPGAIDTNVPSPGIALVIWLIGGILAWTGASTFAELGTAIPGEGGVQGYLHHIYGETVGFVAAWMWIVAIMPATLAILSIVFVESAYSSAGITDQAATMTHKLLSVLVLVVLSVANSISTKASTRLNSFFVAVKFATILAVFAAGLAVIGLRLSHKRTDVGGDEWLSRSWFAYRKTTNPDGSETDWTILSQWEILGHYSAALYGALWAYSGWDKAIYVSAELSEPSRQLPLALNSALPTIIVCFLAVNASYYVLLPWDVLSTSDSVAVTAITRLLGRGVGILAAIFINITVAGTLLGTSFVASRMAVAAANKGWLPQPFAVIGRVGLKPKSTQTEESITDEAAGAFDAPINAVIMSVILGTMFILFGNFRDLLTITGLGEYTFFLLAVLGAVILRRREPDLHRPYKANVVVPIIFIAVSGFVVVRGAVFAPYLAAVIVASWVVGLGYYWIRKRWFLARPIIVDDTSST